LPVAGNERYDFEPNDEIDLPTPIEPDDYTWGRPKLVSKEHQAILSILKATVATWARFTKAKSRVAGGA